MSVLSIAQCDGSLELIEDITQDEEVAGIQVENWFSGEYF